MGRALVLPGHLPHCCQHLAGHPLLQLVGPLKENTQGRSQFLVLLTLPLKGEHGARAGWLEN